MFCPSCQTEYREGFFECADCRVPLVHDLPRAEHSPSANEPPSPPPETKWVAIYRSGDVYEFLVAADALRRAGIPLAGDERYTGEFRTGKLEQAPYVRTLIVPQAWEEDALRALETLTGQV